MNIDLNKYPKQISIVFFLMLSIVGNTQEKETNNDVLFTTEETAYMNKWFSEVVLEMGLTEETKEKYYTILSKNTSKMSALSTKKNDSISEKELKTTFLNQVESMNMEMKEILSEDQYEIHTKVFKLIVWNTYLRKGWKRD